jgi:hypothetical protein
MTMQSIQNLLTYLNADWLAGTVKTYYILEVTGLTSDGEVWSAEIKDSEGHLRLDSDTDEYVYQHGDTIPEAFAALEVQAAGMLMRIAAYIPG